MRRRTHGFTLIELLVALALLTLLLTAALTINVNTSKAAAQLQSRNDLLPELQIAQNYMAGKLKEAAYIFHFGDNVQLTVAGNTTKNPRTGNSNWLVGTDPIVAFVLPPQQVTAGGCWAASSLPAGSARNDAVSNACYAFYAYYGMKRFDYLAAVTGADDPGKSPDQSDDADPSTGTGAGSWVLVEYRAYYSSSDTNFATNFSPASSLTGYDTFPLDIPTGGSGRLLMDYLPNYSAPGATTSLFTVPNTNVQTAGVTSVTVNLASQQRAGGKTIRVPSGLTTDFATLTIYPRNVGKTALNN
ncbi:prepilin-type N-terminal cleavage/methylation domain-containing protein [Deinococcus sp.]|uniref:prepilin-type N-terminal cleavage/methylation domain-containing protein n=1 Tax=Deinococcus sp. TaxID=47478 RepID=UPI003CC636B6